MANSTEIPCIAIVPKAPHTHTVVFLHGRGDDVHNFIRALNFWCDSQGRTLADRFPSFRWVFPQAPKRQCATSPDIWPQWFDVWNVRNFADHEELQAIGLKEVVPGIRNILNSESSLLGGRFDRIILAGISMGAATSVHTLFNLDVPVTQGDRLGAFLGFSCRCPFAGRTLTEMKDVLDLEGVPDHDNTLRNTPILLEHCVDDPLVLIENGRELRDILRSYGAQVVWKEYPRGGHWFNSPQGVDDAVNFLNTYVLGD